MVSWQLNLGKFEKCSKLWYIDGERVLEEVTSIHWPSQRAIEAVMATYASPLMLQELVQVHDAGFRPELNYFFWIRTQTRTLEVSDL